MDIQLEKRDFLKALEVGGSFAGKSKVLPILDSVKIKIKPDNIVVVSSDGENTISKKALMNTGIESEYEFCVSYKDLYSYIKLIPSDSVVLSINDDNMTIKHQKGSFDMPITNTETFPQVKTDETMKSVTYNSALLNNWIVEAQSFVSDDQLRPVMCGVYLYGDGKELGCCASDGHVLYWDKIDTECDEFHFILSKSAFKSLCMALQDSEEVNVRIGENSILFIANGVSILSRGVEGKYPNFQSVFPKDNNVFVKSNKKELISALSRCKLASNASSLIKLSIDGFNMEISSQDYDFSTKSVENVLVESNGTMAIGFNGDYFNNVLSNVSTEDVVMCMKDPSRPCIVKENDEESNKRMLIMPMVLG